MGRAVGARRSRGLTTSPGTAAQGPGIMGGRLSLGPTAVPACNPSRCPTARGSSVDGGGPLTRPSAPRLVAALNRFTKQKLREQGGKCVPCGARETVQVTAWHPGSRGGLPRKCPAPAGQPLPGTLPAQDLAGASCCVATLGGQVPWGPQRPHVGRAEHSGLLRPLL